MATWDLGKVVGADGKSATLEITGVQNLPYGSDPVITEEVDSTPLARKYRLGIPAGKPGTNAGGGGAGIDDGSVATDTTYSSVKIEAIANQLSQQKADKAGWTPNKIIGTDANGNLVAQDPPEDNGGDAETLGGKPASDYLLKTEGLQMKLLKELDSPSSDFSEGTINVEGKDGCLYAILACTHKTITSENVPMCIFPVGSGGMLSAFLGSGGSTSGNAGIAKRVIKASTPNSITFSNAVRTNENMIFYTSNDCIIPKAIYLIEGVK